MRTYDCGDCDFHIAGPADEVAEEIDAHEEHHRTEGQRMTTQITPEILRDAAALFDPAGVTYRELSAAADKMERAQADEKRIDELAQVFLRAEKEIAFYGLVDWGNQSGNQKDAYRAGIRAVLAKLDEERKANEVTEAATEDPNQWDTLADVPDRVVAVYRTTGGSATFHRRDGKWFEQLGTRPDVHAPARLIGPFREIPF